MSADLEERLGALGAGVAPPPESTEGLRARIGRRRRRRRVVTGLAVVAVIVAAGLTGLHGGSDGATVRSVDRPDRETGTVVVPDVVGMTVPEARAQFGRVQLVGRVHDRDADDWFATVLAQEPPAGSLVSTPGFVGLRTALPAPPASAVCPSFPTADLPGGADSADARPGVDSVALQLVRQTVDDQDNWKDRQAKGVFVARGVIRPWDRVNGEVVVVDDPGYQVVVKLPEGAACPTWPEGSGVNGTAVTYTRAWPLGDTGSFLGVGQLWPTRGGGGSDAKATVRGFATSMLTGWTGTIVADGQEPSNGPTWFALTSDVAVLRVLVAPVDPAGWAVLQVGEPMLTYGVDEVRFPVPGPEVQSFRLSVGFDNRTEIRAGDRSGLERGVLAFEGQPRSALLVLLGDRDQVLAASGNHR
jgi:hypothetical protein